MNKELSIDFGPFRLFPIERRLEREGVELEVGDRAFDILRTLVARPKEVVTKRELMKTVWPDVVVDEGNLRFHIASLRRLLGDDKLSRSYIDNVVGRGYRFTGQFNPFFQEPDNSYIDHRICEIPRERTQLVGRHSELEGILQLLKKGRFLSLVGPGGVGKTVVAQEIMALLAPEFSGSIVFIDLTSSKKDNVVETVAMSLKERLRIPDISVSALWNYLRDKKSVIVLDNCEHVLDSAALLANLLWRPSLRMLLLVTSREALRIDAEIVYKLAPLAVPPEQRVGISEDWSKFPSFELFVNKLSSCGCQIVLTDESNVLIAELCRRMDGIPLGIELMANLVPIFGLRTLSRFRDYELIALCHNKRVIPTRHLRLNASLRWSLDLLAESEILVLRRLCSFEGYFSLVAARSSATCDQLTDMDIVEIVGCLVAKSLLVIKHSDDDVSYRVLTTTKAFFHDAELALEQE